MHGALGELLEVVGAGVGAGGADAGADLVDEVLDARPLGVEEHPRGGDALLVERPCGPGRRRCRSTYGWPRRAPRPSRSSPCRAGRRCRRAGRRATRGSRRTTSRSSPATRRRPAPGRRRGDGALPRRPRRACRAGGPPPTHSRTALNWGRPTPVIIRVVHIAPGPDADLDDVRARLDQVVHAVGSDHVAGHDGNARVERAYGGQCLEHPLLVAVGGVDDQAVDLHRRAAASALPATSPLTPIAAAIRSRPCWSRAGV